MAIRAAPNCGTCWASYCMTSTEHDEGAVPADNDRLDPGMRVWLRDELVGVLIRMRRHFDVDPLLKIAERVHAIDGYPPYLPDDDFRGLLLAPETLVAWVAEVAGQPVGQVALHPRTGQPVMALASDVLGVEASRLGVVTRLLVSPDHRRLGAARALRISEAPTPAKSMIARKNSTEGFATPKPSDVAIQSAAKLSWRRIASERIV